jgi:hypothetical protein
VRDEGWTKLGRAPREQQQVSVTSLEITWALEGQSPAIPVEPHATSDLPCRLSASLVRSTHLPKHFRAHANWVCGSTTQHTRAKGQLETPRQRSRSTLNHAFNCRARVSRSLPCTPTYFANNTRLFEDDAHSVVEIRTDSLSTLRELGPPDLVHLIKQPVKSTNKQVIEQRLWKRRSQGMSTIGRNAC